MYDASFIENCFDNLVNFFNIQNSYKFLSSIYLADTEDVSYSGSMQKLVYTIGDTSEIYTRNERSFIERIKSVIVFSPFTVEGKKSNISCNIIAVDLSDFSDSIYNSIAFMKICNKALDGFNIYLIVSNEAIYIGHDDLENTNTLGCKISYPIMSNIDWDMLQDTFLYVDTKNFNVYYNSLYDAIASIDSCYGDSISLDDGQYYFDEENDEYVFLSYSSLNRNKCLNTYEKTKNDFHSDVLSSKDSLAYIKTNKVNSLELLMDAENIEKTLDEHDISIVPEPPEKNDVSSINEDILDDPEALIKLLKKRNTQVK